MVWAVHGEVPPYVVLEGGGLLVSALLAHEAIALMSGGGEAFPGEALQLIDPPYPDPPLTPLTPPYPPLPPGEALQLKTREVELSRMNADGGAGADESAQPLIAAQQETPQREGGEAAEEPEEAAAKASPA